MRSKIKSGQDVLPGIGVLIMTVQERTLSFLLRCAELVLHDLPLDDSSVPLQPNPGEVTSGNETEWGSLSVEVLEAAYRVPPKFDVSRLQSFVFAKRAECQDDMWALREDPLHFKESLLEWSDHRGEVCTVEALEFLEKASPTLFLSRVKCHPHIRINKNNRRTILTVCVI